MLIEKRIFILLMSCVIYLAVYYRRIRGERELKINYLLEKILFPFSTEGRAALFSVIMAVYLWAAFFISYAAIFIWKVDVYAVNHKWYLVTVGVLFAAAGVDIFYELPLMKGGKLLKCVVAILGILMVLMGVVCLICLIW